MEPKKQTLRRSVPGLAVNSVEAEDHDGPDPPSPRHRKEGPRPPSHSVPQVVDTDADKPTSPHRERSKTKKKRLSREFFFGDKEKEAPSLGAFLVKKAKEGAQKAKESLKHLQEDLKTPHVYVYTYDGNGQVTNVERRHMTEVDEEDFEPYYYFGIPGIKTWKRPRSGSDTKRRPTDLAVPAERELPLELFAPIDKYAKATDVPRGPDALDDLETALFGPDSPAQSELDKARILFAWICYHIAYDVTVFFEGSNGDQTPSGVLETRRAVCEGYANLYRELGRRAGLDVWKVGGRAAASRFEVRLGEDLGHAWNAVKVDGQWGLVDSCWGAGYVTSAHTFLHRFAPFFFLTQPRALLYTHLPDMPEWQLVEEPLTTEQFDQQVIVHTTYFTHHLSALSHKERIIQHNLTDNPEQDLKIEVQAPPSVQFMFKLTQLLANGRGQALSNQTCFWERGPESVSVRVAPPGPGTYNLEIFSSDQAEKGQSHRVTFQGSLEYHLQFVGDVTPAHLPVIAGLTWAGWSLHAPLHYLLKAGVVEFELSHSHEGHTGEGFLVIGQYGQKKQKFRLNPDNGRLALVARLVMGEAKLYWCLGNTTSTLLTFSVKHWKEN